MYCTLRLTLTDCCLVFLLLRCFGFVTFRDPASVEGVINSGPHILDDQTVRNTISYCSVPLLSFISKTESCVEVWSILATRPKVVLKWTHCVNKEMLLTCGFDKPSYCQFPSHPPYIRMAFKLCSNFLLSPNQSSDVNTTSLAPAGFTSNLLQGAADVLSYF